MPGSVVIAIWGLETDFGVDIGKTPVLRSLATLAHDCRRSQMFQGELLAALQIIDRGDLSPAEMRGAWAGELGQAQFLPSNYIKYAVDFDGNGRRDLIHSVPDTLASIANLLKSFGWQPGGGYREGSANFAVLAAWNKSTVYQQTIAAFAERLDGRSELRHCGRSAARAKRAISRIHVFAAEHWMLRLRGHDARCARLTPAGTARTAPRRCA